MYMDYFGSNMYVHMHVEIDKDQDHKIKSWLINLHLGSSPYSPDAPKP
jgi:extradiol dioxygenase family protein